MIKRPYWTKRIESAWAKAPIAWLTGVRRTGKTTLAQQFADAVYLNCDLPSTVARLDDPEAFFSSVTNKRLVLDEVHQLPDPSRVLKIAADAFPHISVLATGSSTLAASQKFRDSLTGRKRVVHLVPVLCEELAAFGVELERRLLHGGLPPVLLNDQQDAEFYAEWMDSFFARDVQELFKIEKRSAFLMLLELVLRQSGGLFETTSLAKHSGISRPTVMNYMQVLQETHAITTLRPYSAGGRREILSQPKIYGFDTGFVAYCRGWESLRADDYGLLWEHMVLETLQSIVPIRDLYFWRDKQQREVDFVIAQGRGVCDTIECKWSADAFESRGLKAFRENYPKGRNFLVVPYLAKEYTRTIDGLSIAVVSGARLRQSLST